MEILSDADSLQFWLLRMGVPPASVAVFRVVWRLLRRSAPTDSPSPRSLPRSLEVLLRLSGMGMFADAAKEGRLLSGDTHPVRNGLFVVFALFFATFLVHMIPTMADWWRVQAAGEVIEVVEEGTWVEVAYTWREERLTKRVFADLEVGDAVDLWVHPLDPTNVERQPLIPPLPWRIVVNAMFASGFLFLFTVAVFMVWLLGSPATGGSRDLQRAALEVTTGTVASAVAQWLCGVGWLPAILWCFLDGWVAGALAETWERFSASPSNVPAAS